MTDTDLYQGKDGPKLIYSTINPYVQLVDPLKESSTTLDFSGSPSHSQHLEHFGIWSVKFSGQGNEIIAGTSRGGLCIYDLEKLCVINFARFHRDDVNSVCWDNKKTSHLLYTGSDDCHCLVWDRRILGEKQKPAGAFIGHTEGVTHITSKGDSRYLASNGKDQLLKVWDLRKMHSFSESEALPTNIRRTRFDYRFQDYPLRGKQKRHPLDCSIQEFSGHYVIATLIRCYYSPFASTGQRYIYSGSADGAVYLFDTFTGKTASKLSISSLLHIEEEEAENEAFYLPIRDVSWHPKYPLLFATSFAGRIFGWRYNQSTL